MTANQPLSLGLVVHRDLSGAHEVADRLHDLAADRGLSVRRLETEADATAAGRVDYVVGIGGDGTLLQAALAAHRAGVPVVGVNLGTVGYLTEFEPEELESLLDTLALPNPPLTPRMTVAAATADGRVWHGINEVVVEKAIASRIVRLAVAIDDHHFATYRADGVIVATPLGSTAYSLSAGGPVVAPELEALVLTPVAPHSLLSRSLVLHPGTVVTLTVDGEREVQVSVDGREACTLQGGEQLRVRRGERPVHFVSLGANPFPQGVRKQFGIDHA